MSETVSLTPSTLGCPPFFGPGEMRVTDKYGFLNLYYL
jgi:hypothetical protein